MKLSKYPPHPAFQFEAIKWQWMNFRLLMLIIDNAFSSKFDLKIKEALHINWTKPNYLWHYLSASFTVLITFRYYFISLQHPWYHTFTFHLLFSFYLTLIIGILYCLNCTSLLLHLIITHLVNTLFNNYVINICPRQLLWFI